MIKRHILFIFMLLPTVLLVAQDTLSLEQALRNSLENNYGIQAAQVDAIAARNNATSGGAGLLPTVTLNGRANYNWNNTSVTFQNGEKTSVDGLSTDNQSGDLTVRYPLAGIIAGLTNLKRLRSLSEQSEIQARATIEQSLSQLIAAYYNLARQQRAVQIAEEGLTVSRERLRRVQVQREYGLATRLASLNAEVNLNADSVNYLNGQLALDNARRNLLALMGDDVERDIAAERDVTFSGPESLEDIMDAVEKKNVTVELASYNIISADYNLKIARAAQLPNLDLSVGYGINRSFNGPINFVTNVNGDGLAASATFSWNLFNGGQVKTQIQNAEVAKEAAKLRFEETKLNLFRDLNNAVANYRSGLDIIDLQEKSLVAARLNFEQTQSRYKLGQANGIELREAQLNLLQVQNQLNNLRFDTKVVEMELMRLMGDLMIE